MGDPPEPRPERPIGDRPTPAASRRQYIKSGVLLAVTGVSLYLLLPSLLSVLSSWPSLKHLDWPFAVLVLLFELASWICLWELDRIALGSTGWFTIATGQLAGNALGRIIPGSATPFTVVMLRKAGVDGGEAAAALTASTGLQIATALALPVLAVPAMLGVHRSTAVSRWPPTWAWRSWCCSWEPGPSCSRRTLRCNGSDAGCSRLLNATIRRRRPVEGLPEELISDRNFIRTTLDRRWKAAILAAAGNTGFDYLALLCALRAVGASPRPSLVVLAYASAELLAQIPFTPGGLGFVEAGLVGTLTLAGVPGHEALAATLLYRLVSYWLPIPVGGVAYLLFRRRYGSTTLGERQAGEGVCSTPAPDRVPGCARSSTGGSHL